jgi:RimJ/RimL family protein N-acetyltransferase
MQNAVLYMLNPRALDCFMSGVSLSSILNNTTSGEADTEPDPEPTQNTPMPSIPIPKSTRTEMATTNPLPPPPIFTLPPTPHYGSISVRQWHPSLAPSLSSAANNRAIWANLRDRIPHPYTLADAEWWIEHCSQEEHWPVVRTFAEEENGRVVEQIVREGEGKEKRRPSDFAIVAVDPRTGVEEAIGAIGIVMGGDVAKRTGELGYWLSQDWWGRGVMGGWWRSF